MTELLITGAIISLGYIIYNTWKSDTQDREEKYKRMKSAKTGCVWFFILIGIIILIAIISD